MLERASLKADGLQESLPHPEGLDQQMLSRLAAEQLPAGHVGLAEMPRETGHNHGPGPPRTTHTCCLSTAEALGAGQAFQQDGSGQDMLLKLAVGNLPADLFFCHSKVCKKGRAHHEGTSLTWLPWSSHLNLLGLK